ncbi:glycosyltransferase family 4 protein [Caulobacter rhizosphaerae]|uniref:glycosyltransferase family 4 protein n=1 Tax=Caulobacter rhizosphaerae TaxID=2010972 RepID=UPI0013D01BAA|nr:glycosyltransferase family 4 protein [Caulobacter rhizosphaerae]GGL18855.1 glycosyl transferase [Caulobacter rhizosphaerae]
MKKKRVAIVIPEGLSGRGGIVRVTAYLTRHIQAHIPDIETHVYRSRYSDNAVLKHLTAPFALAAFALQCGIGRIDVAHLNVAPRGSTLRKQLYQAVAKALGMRTVLHLHGSGYDEFYADLTVKHQAAVRAFFARADAVVALGDHWKRFMLTELRLPLAKVVEIPNGVPAAPAVARAPNAVPAIAFLGEVGHRKGVDVLIDALAQLKADGLDFAVTIGGNGDLETARAHAERAGVLDRIDFPGWVDEAGADKVLRGADLLVLPSRAENQPVAILEAMARGLPVVSTRIGGIPQQVLDGETGLLVEPDDVAQLAQALATLIQSPERRAAYGQAGLRRFEAHFSVAACAERFAELYRSL